MEHRIRAALDVRSGSVLAVPLRQLAQSVAPVPAAPKFDAADATARRRSPPSMAAARERAVHANVLAARIAEDACNPRSAMVHWTRRCPALGRIRRAGGLLPRVTAAILRGRDGAIGNACDAMSEALLERLRENAATAWAGRPHRRAGQNARRARAHVRGRRARGTSARERSGLDVRRSR